jgi:F420-non-reducing hydrogenase iron-sulfur subunit
LKRVEIVRQLLDLSGIGSDRLQLRWVSAAEGQIFANYVKELSESIGVMGPFDPDRFELELAAVVATLSTPRLRWLMGIDRQITERENVYHEKIDETRFADLMQVAVETEYQKALICEALKPAPMSVREIAVKTSLPIYTVSQRLGDLEKYGRVDLCSYDGTTPRFTGLAA